MNPSLIQLDAFSEISCKNLTWFSEMDALLYCIDVPRWIFATKSPGVYESVRESGCLQVSFARLWME